MVCSAYSCINMQNAGRFIVNLQHASGTDVLHDVVHGLLQVAVLADVLLHRIDGVHNGGMVTLKFEPMASMLIPVISRMIYIDIWRAALTLALRFFPRMSEGITL